MKSPVLPFLLSLTALAPALALPTSNNTDILYPRASKGWIGSFVPGDCHGAQAGSRPEIFSGVCQKFTPATANVGINYGSSMYSFTTLTFYEDANCKTKYGGKTPVDTQGSGASAYRCWHPDPGYKNGGGVGSVMAN